MLLAVLVALLLYKGAQPDVVGLIPPPPFDKLAHLTVYAAFGALAFVGLGARTTVWAVFCGLAIGLGDEWWQSLHPGRVADWGDLIADGVGAAFGAFATRWLLVAQSFTRGADSRR